MEGRNLVPTHLEMPAHNVKHKKDSVTFDIQCKCGCSHFDIYEHSYSEEEKQQIEAYEQELMKLNKGYEITYTKDAEGNGHWWRKRFLFFKQEFEMPKTPWFYGLEAWKIQCLDCGLEYVLFDSRLHGYDAVTTEEVNERLQKYIPSYKMKRVKDKQTKTLQVEISNELPYEEFCQEVAEDERLYANAFGSIDVWLVNAQGKKTNILSAETA